MSMIKINRELCKGCIDCIRVCPTEALRVRQGKAILLEDRCIDCGECITICPEHAIEAILEELKDMSRYKIKIALVSSVLYAQFGLDVSPYLIRSAIKRMGFDVIMDVAFGTGASSIYLRELIKENPNSLYISSMCPSVVKLIQIRFPSLADYLTPIPSPEEISARYVRERFTKDGYRDEEIGIFLITPCTAKISDIKEGRGIHYVNGSISVAEAYRNIIRFIKDVKEDYSEPVLGEGISWVRDGGEAKSLGILNYLVVDGVRNVLKVLDDLDLGKLRGISFVEGRMCSGGCVGGPLNVQNPYLSRVKIRMLEESGTGKIDNDTYGYLKSNSFFSRENIRLETSPYKLGEDISIAIDKMRRLEDILRNLPGINCGSCGAPNCRALAEDIVNGEARITDCIFKLKDNIEEYARNLLKMIREEK
ncbi:MAG: 4Fe-4S binding protein [bacterium]|nr:4Fe-4S binding protein [bacterium]